LIVTILDKVFLCTHKHAQLWLPRLSITEEACKALLREKKSNESFAETILRITEKLGKLSDCFGTWNMTNEEERIIFSGLSQGWRTT
jgi:predicted CopG family antitoxin